MIFDKYCINKNVFHKSRRPINIDEEENRRIVLCKRFCIVKKDSFKYFIGFINKIDVFPVPLCKKISQMNGYVKCFNKNSKYLNLLVFDKE